MSAYSLVNVASWTSERVSSWIKGLDSRLAVYADNFLTNGVTGSRLLGMTNDDLYGIGVTKVGHQEILLNLINLLDSLCSGLEQETLLCRTLQLSCRARSLYCELNAAMQRTFSSAERSADHVNRRQLYLAILVGVSEIASALKNVSLMFDKIQFDKNCTYKESRDQLIEFGLKLLCTCQDDGVINKLESVGSLCHNIEMLCEYLITKSVDPLVIHTPSLELVTIHKKTEEDLGLDLRVQINGVHMVGLVAPGSNASMCKKIKEGDEVVYVNGHTIVGWNQQSIVFAFKDNQKDLTLLLKKYPHHTSFTGFQKKPPAYKELPKLNIGTKLRRTYGREKSSQRSSQDSLDSLSSLPDHSLDGNASDNDVFHSKDPSTSSVHFTDIESKLRRVTVSGGSPTPLRSPLSAMDLAVSRSASKARPKSLFPRTDLSAAQETSLAIAESKQLAALSVLSESPTNPDLASNASALSLSGSILESSSPTFVGNIPTGKPSSTSYVSVTSTPSQRSQPVSQKSSSTSLASSAPRDFFSPSPSTDVRSQAQVLSSSYAGNPWQVLGFSGANKSGNSPLSKQSEGVLLNEVASFGDIGASPQLLSMLRIDSFKRRELDEKDRKASVSSLSSLDFDSKPGSPVPSIVSVGSRRTPLKDREMSQNSSGLLRKKNFLQRVVGVNRRISCKDLGGGDCQGWLWKKKEGSGLRAGRWVKFWFVLQQKNLYFYKDPDDAKADGVIHLVGFQVSPADSHSKKYAFKALKSDTSFTFAAERQDDMAKWMNKIGLASLPDFDFSNSKTTAGFVKPDKPIYEDNETYFSESEDDLSPVSTSKGNVTNSTSSSDSREDLSEFYRQMHHAKRTLSRSLKNNGSSLLRGAALEIDPESEKCRHLLSLKRTLKDKEHDLSVVDGFLSLDVVTSQSLHSFVERHPDMLKNCTAFVSSEDYSSTSGSDSETLH